MLNNNGSHFKRVSMIIASLNSSRNINNLCWKHVCLAVYENVLNKV